MIVDPSERLQFARTKPMYEIGKLIEWFAARA